MKRNNDLVRDLMLKLEEQPPGSSKVPSLDGHSPDEINYHMALLVEAGWIQGHVSQEIGVAIPPVTFYRITFAGHDFLDSARDIERWGKAVTAATSVGAMSLEVLKAVLVDLATSAARRALGA